MIAEANRSALLATDRLAAQLDDPAVRIVDATWFMPTEPQTGRESYLACHIRGAVHSDIDAAADRSIDLPHMLPDAATFARLAGALGIGSEHRVIVYDAQGVVTAPRVWWTLRVFGHDAVFVLDGGLPKWRAEGRPVNSGAESAAPATFTARFRPELVSDVEAMRTAVADGGREIVDARSPGRFHGSEPEPRPGVRSGHMPGARNLHYAALIEASTHTFRPVEQLRDAFIGSGVDLTRPIATSCGSGVTASILALALHEIGHRKWAVYDGSWAEWGARADLPVEL